MKYKVGDKVRIRKDLVQGTWCGGFLVNQKMQELGGKIARITTVANERIASGAYRIDLAPPFIWTDKMFEDVDTEVQEMNKRVVINVDGNKVIARCGDKNGFARCHPDDTFDFYVGAKLALERLEEVEKPYGWLNVGKKYYFPAPGVDNLYNYAIYTANGWDKRIMERGIVFKTPEEAIECARKMLAAVKKES